jgi:HprK-related kinase A
MHIIPTHPVVETPPALGERPAHEIAAALAGDGLWLDIGAAVVHVRSDAPALTAQLQAVYGHFPFVRHAEWADVHCRLHRGAGLRRWVRPQVRFSSDGREIFSPFPADSPLPMFEWGCNWLIGQRMHHLLLMHAAALERDGRALLLPALPGSGKSTLAAALSLRGWRLLSDEFGAFDPVSGLVKPMLKPPALKNQSIDVIRHFEPAVCLGPAFPRTRKGTVAHLAPDSDAVGRRHEGARPAVVIMPRWEAGSPTLRKPVEAQVAFSALAFNAFNYQVLGEVGFEAVLSIARASVAWELTYSDLDDAIRWLDEEWPSIVESTAP